MKKEFQEQKLTAYLLGELDEAESREVERILEASESARRQLDELRETIGILAEGLQSEILLTPPETLDDSRRAAVEERIEAAGSKTGQSKSFFSSSWIWGLSAAASLLLAALLSYPFWPWRSDSGQIMQQAELRSEEMKRSSVREAEKDQTLLSPHRELTTPEKVEAAPGPPAAASPPREARMRQTVPPPPQAAIAGHITDATGAALPGVDVKLRSAPTGELKVSTVSDAAGQFQVPAVPGNQYLVEAELPGFKSALVGPLTSKSGESVDASLRLEVGEVSSSVAVTGRADRASGPPSVASTRAARPTAADTAPAVSNREAYDLFRDNPFVAVSDEPLSTFSIDVDTASYSNLRRFLNAWQAPPPDAVRIEEMLNSFDYSYAPPTDRHPIAAHVEVADAFWKPEHRLVRIGLRARDLPSETPTPVKGNGDHPHIGDFTQAHRALVEPVAGTLLPVAKDVKIQVEFNPHRVAAYRLIGYENRVMAHHDFADDTRDPGEMGARHTVTAFYEVVPVGVSVRLPDVEPLKYQSPAGTAVSGRGDLLTLKIRYKDPGDGASRRLEVPVTDQGLAFHHASDDFRFAAAVASFGMVLRKSPHQGETTLNGILEIARSALGADPGGHRADFMRLVLRARELGY